MGKHVISRFDRIGSTQKLKKTVKLSFLHFWDLLAKKAALRMLMKLTPVTFYAGNLL